MTDTIALQKRIRLLLLFFMVALTISGLTAIPLQWELSLLNRLLGSNSIIQQTWPALAAWIIRINDGVQNGYGQYPFLAYGTDWLAFAHIVIAIAFIGPLRDPVKNIWVIEFGEIACLLTIPWILIFGAIRAIPFFWQSIDALFGIVGMIPLWIVHRDILQLKNSAAIIVNTIA